MALTINYPLELTTGIIIPENSHVKIGINIPERDSDQAVITLGIYLNLSAYNSNKDRILNVVNLPCSFFVSQNEDITNPIFIHQKAIEHICNYLQIEDTLINMVL